MTGVRDADEVQRGVRGGDRCADLERREGVALAPDERRGPPEILPALGHEQVGLDAERADGEIEQTEPRPDVALLARDRGAEERRIQPLGVGDEQLEEAPHAAGGRSLHQEARDAAKHRARGLSGLELAIEGSDLHDGPPYREPSGERTGPS